jgi:HKD family nuclease
MKNRDIRLLTSLLPMDIASGATSLEALRVLIESGVECRYLREHPRLHAKVYIFGGVSAVVTSANLTGSAFDSNIEVGVEVDGSDVQDLTEWFDRFWQKAYPLTASQAANLEEQTAVLRHDYRELKRKTDIQLPLKKEPLSSNAVLNELRDLLEHARQFFVCNTNRNERIPAFDGRDNALEQEMHNRGYAVAWYRFNYDSHMKRVKPGDAIFMFAVGGVGIIGIGRAKTECEKPLAWEHPDRIDKRLRKKHEPEWRVPVQWLAWCDDKDAYGWTGIAGTFRDVTDDKYKDKREGTIQHFLGGLPGRTSGA